MPVDASIPLQAQGPAPITMNSIAQMMQMKQMINQQRQQQASQNALRQIFSNPGNLDANGMPNNDAMQKISMVSPQMGMALRQQSAKMDSERALAMQRNAGMVKDKASMLHDALEPSVVTYQESLSQGLPPEQAQAKAQQVYSDNLKNVQQSGLFSQQEIQQMPTNFDPVRVGSGVLKYKDFLGLQEKKVADQRADQRMADQDMRSNRQFGLEMKRLDLAEHNSQRADQTAAGTEPGGKLDDETLDVMAQQYLAGDKSVMSNLGRGRQGAENIVALRKRIVQNAKSEGMNGAEIAAHIAEFGGSQAGERTLGQTQARVGMAVNEAGKFAVIAKDASDAMPRGEFVPVNKAIQAYQSGTSDPKMAAFAMANLSLANAYATAVGRGQPTDSARQEALKHLSTASSQTAYTAVVDQVLKETAAANASPAAVKAEMHESITGGSKGSKKLVYDPATGTFK